MPKNKLPKTSKSLLDFIGFGTKSGIKLKNQLNAEVGKVTADGKPLPNKKRS